MKIYLLIISTILISSCSSKAERVEMEWDFPNCGTSILNNSKITKVCATRDFIAQKPRKRKKDWFGFLAAEGSSGYKGPIDQEGGLEEFKNKELDMKRHVWDFSEQNNPSLVLQGNDSAITNGIILNVDIILGDNGYFTPNFTTGEQVNNSSVGKNTNSEIIKYGFLYVDNLYDCKKGTYVPCNIDQLKILENAQRLKKRENMFIKNIKNKANDLTLQSWEGGILNSQLILKNRINIYGSKATIINNKIISNAELKAENSIFPLIQIKKSNLIAHSQQIFPDENDDQTAIPSTLYIKFSPDTVIDGNTFTLTQKNDETYAIVLDHSPRVRITNNTFNGFKVPILMDQWSSIVDEKGNEIKPENFTGYGNIINPNEFAGHVTMNRKGEIVKE